MSKKKNKEKKDAAPLDYQLATKNLQYTIVIKDTDIDRLKTDNNTKSNYILSLENEISTLRANAVNAFELENKLKKILKRNEILQKESDNFNNRLIEERKKFEEEKKRMENTYKSEINHLRLTMDAYVEKVRLTNQLLADKEKLEKDLEEANNKNKEIIQKNNEALTTMKIRNGIKFTNLKNKMSENIQKTKNKVTDLNLQYMDVSSKLTILQNHQLLIQLEYQTQQIDALKEKNKILEKQVYDLSKEIEVHKNVELSLAEKNKALSTVVEKSQIKNLSITSYGTGWKDKNKKISKFNNTSNKNLNTTSNIKTNNIKTENKNNFFNEEDKLFENNNKIYRKTISFNHMTSNNINNNNKSNFNSKINNNSNSVFNSNIFNSNINASYNFNNNKNINNENSRIINLENKIINLEKKLSSAKKDYNSLLDKNEFIKTVLQNYENKYTGLFNFLEECLNNFYNDEELKNNKEIYVNIDSIQKGDFNSLNKEEKYSTLIILMKYLMPLMNNKNIDFKNNPISNINIKIHDFNINQNKRFTSFSNNKNKKIKKYIMNTTNNFYNNKKLNIIDNKNDKHDKSDFDPLPSISKISLVGSRVLMSKSLNKNKTNNKLN